MSTVALKFPIALEKFVSAQIKHGVYRSREELIIAAVAGEKRRTEQREWLQGEISKGLTAESAGMLNMESIIRRGRARVAAQKRRRS